MTVVKLKARDKYDGKSEVRQKPQKTTKKPELSNAAELKQRKTHVIKTRLVIFLLVIS